MEELSETSPCWQGLLMLMMVKIANVVVSGLIATVSSYFEVRRLPGRYLLGRWGRDLV